MTVKKSITLPDDIAAIIEEQISREPWRNVSSIISERLYKSYAEEGLIKKEEAESKKS